MHIFIVQKVLTNNSSGRTFSTQLNSNVSLYYPAQLNIHKHDNFHLALLRRRGLRFDRHARSQRAHVYIHLSQYGAAQSAYCFAR